MISESDLGAARGGFIVESWSSGELGGGVVADEIVIAVKDVTEDGPVQKAVDDDAEGAGQDERDPHRRIVTSARTTHGKRRGGWTG